MSAEFLVFPMFAQVVFTWLLGARMFFTRVAGVKSGRIPMNFFKTYQGASELPEDIVVIGRNFDNQFQLPLLFQVGCLAHIAIGSAGFATFLIACTFVLSRLLHSYIHLGANKPLLRARVYITGWFLTIVLWGQLCYFVVVRHI